jgi:hypothetical protein
MKLKANEFGQKWANPNSTFEMVGVTECDAPAVCKDYYSDTVADTNNITAFVLVDTDGTETTITLDSAVSVDEPADLKAAIEAKLADYEFNVRVDVAYSGGALTFAHYGATTVKSLTASAAGALTTARQCTMVTFCDFTAQLVGAVPNLTINGNDEALADTPFAYAGGVDDATTAGELKSNIEGALDNQSITYDSVTVTVNDDDEAFDVVIVAQQGVRLIADDTDGTRFVEQACITDFIA